MEKKIVYLHEIPRQSLIKENVEGKDEEGEPVLLGDMVRFHRVDGMYSFCTVEGGENHNLVVHLSVMTPLIFNDEHNYYEIYQEN